MTATEILDDVKFLIRGEAFIAIGAIGGLVDMEDGIEEGVEEIGDWIHKRRRVELRKWRGLLGRGLKELKRSRVLLWTKPFLIVVTVVNVVAVWLDCKQYWILFNLGKMRVY